MSFSSKVKEELSKECNSPRHCCIAETAAIISMCGKVIFDEKDHVRIEIHTENVTVARKYFTLLKKTYSKLKLYLTGIQILMTQGIKK